MARASEESSDELLLVSKKGDIKYKYVRTVS